MPAKLTAKKGLRKAKKRLPSGEESYSKLEEVGILRQELREALAQQTATSEVLRAVAGSPTNLQAVLDTVAKNAARLCEATDAYIHRIIGNSLKRVANYGPLPTPLGEGPRVITRRSVPGRAIIDRQTIHIHDLAEEPKDDLQASFLRSLGVRTVLSTPLLREGVAIGAIVIRRLEVRPFTDKQIALLKTFADQAVIAIENVRLFQEIQDKNKALAVANERLEELDKLKSDFVSNVSHELRTPLTSIKGSADNMLDGLTGPLNEKQTRYLTRIKANTDRLARLINDILDLSRIETGRLELHLATLRLVPLAKEVTEHLAPVAAPKNISIEVAASDPGITAWADHDKVTQVLMNLVGNAVKFTPPDGKVTVAIERKGEEWVELSVADTGPGIPREESQRIFDKFYQIADGATGTKGTGLGLAISKGLIELHGGQIWVESEVGKGSAFFFTLPAQPKADTTPNREVADGA